jgi:DNA repair exonuclease SbcCD ATPase subunit
MALERIRLSKYKEMQEELDTAERRFKDIEFKNKRAVELLNTISYPFPDRVCPVCGAKYPERHGYSCNLNKAIEVLEDDL